MFALGPTSADTRSFIMRDSFVLSEPLAEVLIPFLARSGRFVLAARKPVA